jgi:hypothetical protein
MHVLSRSYKHECPEDTEEKGIAGYPLTEVVFAKRS